MSTEQESVIGVRIGVVAFAAVLVAVGALTSPVDGSSRSYGHADGWSSDVPIARQAYVARGLATVVVDSPEWICAVCYQWPLTPTTWEHAFAGGEEEEFEHQPELPPILGGPWYPTDVAPTVRGEEESNRDCRLDIQSGEPGCHLYNSRMDGRCADTHSPCGPGQGLTTLVEAVRLRDYALLTQALSTDPYIELNTTRNALQVLNCEGAVIGHVPVARDEAVRLLQQQTSLVR